MTDDTHRPDDVEDRSNEDHQNTVEACEHALGALENGDLVHARNLLDEAQASIKRPQHDETQQAYHETAYDCYD